MVQTDLSRVASDRSVPLGDEFVLGERPARLKPADGSSSLRDLLGWDGPTRPVDAVQSLARLAIVMSVAMVFIGIAVMISVNVLVSIAKGVIG